MSFFIVKKLWVKPTPKGRDRRYTNKSDGIGREVILIETPDGIDLPKKIKNFLNKTFSDNDLNKSKNGDNITWEIETTHYMLRNIKNEFEKTKFNNKVESENGRETAFCDNKKEIKNYLKEYIKNN
ncbi:MAG: hypothetical protein ACOCP8_03805 [archaeon]